MVSQGNLIYRCDSDPCKGSGYSWTQAELDSALVSDVRKIVYDEEETRECADIFVNGATTQFDMDTLRTMFSVDEDVVKDWQVGEGIACAYLHDHRQCDTPWNSRRDLRTPKGSLPGVDICGIRADDDGSYQFFFCEVKTSSEQTYPPQVASGNPHYGGLAAQVKELRDNQKVLKTIIRYLACRSKEEPWRTRFQCAVGRYLAQNSDVSIFGFMVRDVAPDKKDLEKRVKDVAANTNGGHIEFLALYLPLGSIQGLSDVLVQSSRTGDVC